LPPVGAVRFGSFARTTPIGTRFGLERTGPIDRVYIERWLAQHRGDLHGRVLEFGDDRYTRTFGSAVQRGDVLHPEPGAAGATLCGDLRTGEGIPTAAYDCIVCTQVLQFVSDPARALAVLAQALVPGGVLLGSVPVVSPQSPTDAAEFGEYWRFTSGGMRALLTRAFRASAMCWPASRSCTGSVLAN
jgi:SAM-dependent methyltransferase